MISKTFCILPWIHFYANPDGNVLPCCIGDHHRPLGNVQTNSMKEIWNNTSYRNIRLKMLSGESCAECKSCYSAEAAGVKSFRQSVNNDYSKWLNFAQQTNPDGSLDFMQLKYLDIRWSNICNFKCRSCSSTYSSSWAIEDNKYGQNKKVLIFADGKDNESLYEQVEPHLYGLEEIYFAGGEPLLMDRHYQILEQLIKTNNTKIRLRYNSNLSSLIYKNKSVIDLWDNFPNINLNISLDSWGSRAEYIREGTDWNIIENNIITVKEKAEHIQFGVATVVSIFNVFTLSEFIDYMIQKNLVDNKTNATFYCLLNPNFYSFNILDIDLKKIIIDKLSKRKYNNSLDIQIDNVIKHLQSSIVDQQLQKQFVKHTEYYDKIRNRRFIETFPELKEFYENILR